MPTQGRLVGRHQRQPPTGQPSSSRVQRVLRWLAEVLPPLVVGLGLLPFIIAHGTVERPSTIDLQVYWYAVRDLVAGNDIYHTETPHWGLRFIYPPAAALLMTPLLLFTYGWWQVGWTLLGVVAQQDVLRRCGLPRGWLMGVLGAALLATFEPLRTTLGYGQVNTLLMWCVVADLLPDPPGTRRRWLPRGTLIGVAAAVKLTPLLFVAWLVVSRRWRTAAVSVVSFAGLTGVAFVLFPAQSTWFFTHLGAFKASGTMYVGNQALSGVAARVVTRSENGAVGVVVGMVVALVTVLLATWLWRRGQAVLAVGLVGLASCLASPLAWTHHYVWVVVILAALVIRPDGGVTSVHVAPRASLVPKWWRGAAWALVVWVALCLPLALLPYANQRELKYRWWQQVIANAGPVWACLIVLALVGWVLAQRPHKARTPSVAA